MTTASPRASVEPGRHQPLRTCVGCGRSAPQAELVRFVARGGELVPDRAPRGPGRGAYTCRRAECFERAVSRRAFARTLRRRVSVPDGLNPLALEV